MIFTNIRLCEQDKYSLLMLFFDP